jgi:hypothetical protein
MSPANRFGLKLENVDQRLPDGLSHRSRRADHADRRIDDGGRLTTGPLFELIPLRFRERRYGVDL